MEKECSIMTIINAKKEIQLL